MMSWRAWTASLVTAFLVAACGGGGGSAGTPTIGGGTTPVASDLTVTLSSATVVNSTASTVEVVITAVDANRAVMSGVAVSMAVNSGATISAASGKTDSAGQVKATVGIGSDTTPRTVTVTVTSGALTKTASFSVVAGGADTPVAADMTVTLSAPVMANSPSAKVDVTVTAVDANRAAVKGVPVTLAVNAGATVTQTNATSDESGLVKGTVSIGSDTSPRTITITVKSGALTRTVTVDVVAATAASDLTLTLSPSAVLSNSGTSTVTATVTAVDRNRNTVAGMPIVLSVDSGATVQVSAATSDSKGQITGVVSIGEDKSNRVITVTAVSGSVTKTAAIQVTGAKINATVLGAVLAPGQTGTVQYRLVDVNGNPIPGKRLTISGPSGIQTVATTGTNGEYDFVFKAPNATGTIDIRASAAGVESTVSVFINSGSVAIPKVETTVRSASVSANPAVVAINTGSTSNRAEVRALFLSDDNKPVKNIRVRFDLDGDKNSIGGTFTSGTTQVYSDVNGVATAAYVPASRFSPTDGVTVRACWDYDDFDAAACPNAARTTLTVISDSLSVSIGTNTLIGTGDSGLTYVVRYVVQVVDSSGLAVPDVQVSAQVDLPQYFKGYWTRGITSWVQVVEATCDNEDLNRNGVAEIFSNGVVEDANGSFNLTPGRPALEPRKADVAISFEGSSKTNVTGQAILRIEYPQNIGSWVRFNIVVSASGVAGTEGRANYMADLWVPASVVNKLDTSPPFVLSPYGVQTSPTVAATVPGSTKPASRLCTNPN